MEIKVQPKRHHNHVKEENVITSDWRKSPKFPMTTTIKTTTRKINVKQAGAFKGQYNLFEVVYCNKT